MSFKTVLQEMIITDGPMPFERYMGLCLGHPVYGYYLSRDPFGREGDFITAPEVSQMFGELIGLWVAQTWQSMGSPSPFHLVELGPGRGTLMSDALRALKVSPECLKAVRLHLVEISAILREQQKKTLADIDIQWHSHIEELPQGPAIFIANEFFDALPVRQYLRHDGQWHERTVIINSSGELDWSLSPSPERLLERAADDGAILELCPLAVSTISQICRRFLTDKGALLILDYGYTHAQTGDTVQSMARHAFVDVLATPGEADMTAHVNFNALAAAARHGDCLVQGPVSQGDFLEALGLHVRAAMLAKKAKPEHRKDILSAVERLTDRRPTGMGELFKVMGISSPSITHLQGFGLPHLEG